MRFENRLISHLAIRKIDDQIIIINLTTNLKSNQNSMNNHLNYKRKLYM